MAGILRLRGVLVPFGKLDVEHADVVEFVGTNPALAHPLTVPQSSPGRRLPDSSSSWLGSVENLANTLTDQFFTQGEGPTKALIRIE